MFNLPFSISLKGLNNQVNLQKSKYLTPALLSLLFLFGFVYNLWFSRLGLNPLDSSIVFDGAWRLLDGQIPIADYNTPNGFIPIMIQGLFFKVFGVNWLAYALHSSLINGLFTVVSFLLLKKLGLKFWLSFIFSIFSAIVFYPPTGTPYMDQHAFFFVTLCMFWGVMLIKNKGKNFVLYCLLLPPTAAMAFLSKQNPSLWLIVFFIIFPLLISKENRIKALKWIGVSLVGTLIFIWLFMEISGIAFTDFIEQYFNIPRALGKQRFNSIESDQITTLLFYKPYEVIQINSDLNKFIVVFTHVIAIVTSLITKNKELIKNYLVLFFIYHFSILSSSWFVALTDNQPSNGIPFVFLSFALLAMVLSVSSKEILKHYGKAKAGNVTAVILSISVMIYCLPLVVRFHNDVVSKRQVHDFYPDQIKESSFNLSFETKKFLSYQLPYHYHSLDIYQMVDFLRNREGDFFLFGDLSILYALSNKTSKSPYLWFHPGLTFYDQNSGKWEEEDKKLAGIISNPEIKYLIFEIDDRQTYLHLYFSDFNYFKKAAESRFKRSFMVGGFEVWELN